MPVRIKRIIVCFFVFLCLEESGFKKHFGWLDKTVFLCYSLIARKEEAKNPPKNIGGAANGGLAEANPEGSGGAKPRDFTRSMFL